jgi:hypothetical protein
MLHLCRPACWVLTPAVGTRAAAAPPHRYGTSAAAARTHPHAHHTWRQKDSRSSTHSGGVGADVCCAAHTVMTAQTLALTCRLCSISVALHSHKDTPCSAHLYYCEARDTQVIQRSPLQQQTTNGD